MLLVYSITINYTDCILYRNDLFSNEKDEHIFKYFTVYTSLEVSLPVQILRVGTMKLIRVEVSTILNRSTILRSLGAVLPVKQLLIYLYNGTMELTKPYVVLFLTSILTIGL